MLVPEIESKLEFRGRTRAGMAEELSRKERRYRRLWSPRLGSQMAELPCFDEVYRSVRRSVRAAGFLD